MATLDVKVDYNAAGDGVTDDTQAIQSAIDDATDGDTVFFPSGTYIVDFNTVGNDQRAVFFDQNVADNLTVKGADFSSATIKLADNATSTANNPFIVRVSVGSGISGLSIEQLTIDGNKSGSGLDRYQGVWMGSQDNNAVTSDITLEHVHVKDAQQNNISVNTHGVTINRVTSSGAGKNHGIALAGGNSGISVTNSYCHDNAGSGIDAGGAVGPLVEDTVCDSNDDRACKVGDSPSVTFRRVRMTNSKNMGNGDGFQTTGSTGATVTMEDVIATGNPRNGLFLRNGHTYDLDGVIYASGNNSSNNGDGNVVVASAGTSVNAEEIRSENPSNGSTLEAQNSSDLTVTRFEHPAGQDAVDNTSGTFSISNNVTTDPVPPTNVPTISEVGAGSSASGGGGGGSSPSTESAGVGVEWVTARDWYNGTQTGTVNEDVANTNHGDATQLTQGYNYTASSVRPAALVLDAPMHERSGTTMNDLAGTNDGTITGAVTLDATGVVNGSAYSVDSTDGKFVEVSDAASLDVSNVTVSVWVEVDGTDGSDGDSVINRAGVANLNNDNHVFAIQYETNPNPSFEASVVPQNEQHTLIQSDQISTDTRYHVVTTYNSSAHALYVDKERQAVNNSVSTALTTTADKMYVLSGNNNFDTWGGEASELRIWNEGIDGSEVSQLYDVVASNATFTSDWQSPDSDLQGNVTVTSTVPANAAVTLHVDEDTTGDQVADNTGNVNLAGGTNETAFISALAGDASNQFRFRAEYSVTNPTDSPASIDRVFLNESGGAAGTEGAVSPRNDSGVQFWWPQTNKRRRT